MLLANRQSEIGNRKSARQGVTLMEIVISIFILSVGVLGIISLFPSGYRLSQAAIDRNVVSLAAQDAVAHLVAESKNSTLPGWGDTLLTFPALPNQPYVSERDRVGTIAAVASANSVQCYVCGDVLPQGSANAPHYWPSLGAGYYLVMTSGTCAGCLYPISAIAGSIVTLNLPATVTLRVPPAKTGDPIRVGDHFALIGSSTGTLRWYPRSGTVLPPGLPAGYPASFGADFTAVAGVRTMPVSTEGDYTAYPWLYSYGAIVSPPTPEMRRICRVDVFLFRSFDPTSTVAGSFNRPASHVITYVPVFSDLLRPDQ